MHLMTFLSAWCSVVASSAIYFMKIPIIYPQKWQWAAMLIFIGLSGFTAQVHCCPCSLILAAGSCSQTLLTMGYQRETATRGSMGQYVQFLFAEVLEYVFFATVPSILSFIGAVIIMTSATYAIMCLVLISVSSLSNLPSSSQGRNHRGNPRRSVSESGTLSLQKATCCILNCWTGRLNL
ncbi:uncharacterized protein EDB91DRAFT_193164 [Suillus paluster]|uniref:uncharacterized protein n=1 Tax=Suillus paluster TaxID=48578 RepID=UPI001B883DD2|nr:uncharacterized protein EDB91DRAFT_193164 [Suillus paluster]KAG1744600.1 hypothetical protein EDB91DRAFT_193164 [Suillus paluster]